MQQSNNYIPLHAKQLAKVLSTVASLLLYVLLTTGCNKSMLDANDSTFLNPLLPAGADPWVLKKDSFYYYTSTTSSEIILYRTKFISRLSQAERKVIWQPLAIDAYPYYLWAPELHFINDKWYLYFSAGSSTDLGSHRMFVLENASPNPLEGSWTNKGKVFDADSDYFAIDATVLELNNKQFLVWSSLLTGNGNKQCLYISELTNPWTLATHRILISQPQYDWEKVGSAGVNEGPEILKNKNGKVFLFFSASGCWTDSYCLGMLTLKDGGNPLNASDWIKYSKPLLTTHAESKAFSPGHNSFFKSPDGTEDWIIYHANPEANQQCSGYRSPRIQCFKWNSDGTPSFGTPLPLNKKIKRPSGEKD